MSSREKILQAISANKPPLTQLPLIDTNQVIHFEDLIVQFKTVLESIGGIAIEVNDLNVKVYIQGTLGVAENGAIWLYEHHIINRLLPFICQHLVLILHKKDLVSTLHEAYQHIHIARDGYGVFLAGPSKTADIEQSLVIGAHGARSLVVYLV